MAEIVSLNLNPELDFLIKNAVNLNNHAQNDNPYLNVTIDGKFHDINSLLQLKDIHDSPVYISINVQSLNSKFECLCNFMSELSESNINVEILAIQECWKVEYPELLIIPGYHPFIFKQREGMRGGGVGFFIKSYITFEIVPTCSYFESKIFESITLLLSHPSNFKLYVTSLYRSNGTLPNISQTEQRNRFNHHLDDLLLKLSQKRQKSFIFSDSNIDLLTAEANHSTHEYLNSILSHGFLQTVIKATRIQGASSSLIDHIITNCSNVSFSTGSIITDVSDHFPIFILNGKNKKQNEQKHINSRIFSQTNLLNFKNLLAEKNWEKTTTDWEVDTSYDEFWKEYSSAYDLCFPITRIKFNRNMHRENNFMTAGLLNSRITKLQLLKTYLAFPSDFNKDLYKNYRKIYQKTLRAAKKASIESNLQKNQKNPKETWKILNEVIGKKQGGNSIPKININGQPSESPADISNEFNNFFVRVGKEISDNVPIILKPPEDYLPQYPNITPLNLQNTTPDHIIKIVKNFAPKNSADTDGVSSKMIKFIIVQIAVPLAHIFNLSLQSGTFPSKLQKSRVIPIFKSGNPLECDNYRPISLLSAFSKILEKIVAKKLLTHLSENNLIYDHQYGFLPGRSTEQNLLHVTNYITNALNEKMYCIGIFIDLRKAFDVCSHEILLKKLSLMGITGPALKWFESYLKNRTQFVDLNGAQSDEKELLLSVIQGSILGPILFLCYINDFHFCTKLFTTLFPDDGSCLAKHTNLKILIEFVNSELQKVANWFLSNKMAVNTSKTKYIIFRTQGKPIDDTNLKVVFNSNEIGTQNDPTKIFNIERISNSGATKSFKLLGVLLDEYLSFDAHINHICNKVSKSLYIINRVKNFLPAKTLVTLYFALIHSHLSYCSSIYGCATKTSLTKLQLKQKKAIRIISKSTYHAHTAPLFKNLKILPLENLITYSQLKFMHNFYNNNIPLSFTEMWVTNRSRNPQINLRNAENLHVPAHSFDSIKRLPLFTFPTKWNEDCISKFNPNCKQYLKLLKVKLLENLV